MKGFIIALNLLFTFVTINAGIIPNTTNLILTDCDGITWDIDSLLDSGKHIWMHQAFSG